MRDALGGSVTLVIIVMFIVIALGYMAFNVNYTKAFRMKNKIISIYEDYDGVCDSKCQNAISTYSHEIGYFTSNDFTCPKGFTDEGTDHIYCYKVNTVNPNTNNSSISSIKGSNNDISLSDIKQKRYYTIVTKINLNIPIISKMVDLKVFLITGDTKAFEIQ